MRSGSRAGSGHRTRGELSKGQGIGLGSGFRKRDI